MMQLRGSAYPFVLAMAKKAVFRKLWTNESVLRAVQNEVIALCMDKGINYLRSELMQTEIGQIAE